MRRVLGWMEAVMQVLTVVLSIFTVIEMVKAWRYKRKIAEKAEAYLEEELAADANLSSTINVYSPTIKENENRVKAFLAATSLGCIILIVIKVLRAARD